MAHEWLGSCADVLSLNGVDASLSYVCRREYTIECNWKVWSLHRSRKMVIYCYHNPDGFGNMFYWFFCRFFVTTT